MSKTQAFHLNLLRGLYDAVSIWARGNPLRLIKLWHRYRYFQKATRIRAALKENEGIQVPPVLILSVTMECNLECMGCYSRDYDREGEFTLEEIDQVFHDAKALGINFFVLTGGEPLMKHGLLEVCYKHPELLFLLFTNGTQINETIAVSIARHENIIPLVSIEGEKKATDERRGQGVHEKVLSAMQHLKEARALFGFSSVVTRKNFDTLATDAFIDQYIDRGCRIGFYLGYVPIDVKPEENLLPDMAEQDVFRNQLESVKSKKKMIFVHLPDDEFKLSGTCMAAGGGFLHINAQGFVEPCPFAHIAEDNVHEKSLKDIFKSPFLKTIREQKALLEPPSMGCALYQNRERLCQVVSRFNVKATDSVWQAYMMKGTLKKQDVENEQITS